MVADRKSAPLLFAVAIIEAGILALPAAAQSVEHDAHLAIPNPSDLSKDEALKVYDDLIFQMDAGYAASHLSMISGYQGWSKFNDAPFISATHGQRYVNSYANSMAHNYGTLKDGEKLPAGSVLAKDSMTVTDDNHLYPGAMFVMEKLRDGGNPPTADWRYVMVMPDGSLFGDTIGDRSQEMTYCHECHEAVAERDYTFFVPEDYRIEQ